MSTSSSVKARSVLSTDDLTDEEIREITSHAIDRRQSTRSGLFAALFMNRSTRTRLSLVRSCQSIGLLCVTTDGEGLRLRDGESIRDTARAFGVYADIVGIRAHFSPGGLALGEGTQVVREFASACSRPVVNLECDESHPCQALADIFAIRGAFGRCDGLNVAIVWANSQNSSRVPAVPMETIRVCSRLGCHVRVAHPPGYELDATFVAEASKRARSHGGSVEVSHELEQSVSGADIVYARNWVSSGVANEMPDFAGQDYSEWICNSRLMECAGGNARYMHCLPVDRGFEVSDDVIDGAQSLVREQMESRVIVQSRLIELLLPNGPSVQHELRT
ncbi:MAG: hypothetical protein KDA66_07830 [Planctomycetaceae bacterium]|nr:hypothetical protein [Planctomycetaceae bacterium]